MPSLHVFERHKKHLYCLFKLIQGYLVNLRPTSFHHCIHHNTHYLTENSIIMLIELFIAFQMKIKVTLQFRSIFIQNDVRVKKAYCMNQCPRVLTELGQDKIGNTGLRCMERKDKISNSAYNFEKVSCP